MTRRIYLAIFGVAISVLLVASAIIIFVLTEQFAALEQNTMLLVAGFLPGLIAAIGVALVLALIVAEYTSRKIVEPIDRLNLEAPLDNEVYQEVMPILRKLDAHKKEVLKKRKELMKNKAEAERMRKEFTANVSHEMKTPIQSIAGSAELLMNGLVKEEDLGTFYKRIHSDAMRMGQLVSDIISLSRLDEGGGELVKEDVNLYNLARRVLESLNASAEKNNIKLSLKGDAGIVMRGDVNLLDTLVYNLCDNAIRYNKKNGTVDVVIEETADGDVRLSVFDTGIGIPPESQARVFERFYRVDKSRSRILGGTGLGLSIVKHVAERHNARVELKSIPNNGTTIAVVFPLKP